MQLMPFFPNYVLVKKQFKNIYPEKSEKPTTIYARENLQDLNNIYQ